jgi:hypothetical protein
MLGQEVQEPSLLALILSVTGFAGLLGVCVVAMAGLPAFGYRWWTFAVVATMLVCLAVSLRRTPKPGPPLPTGRQRWFRRLHVGARLLFMAVLACWLGLIAWSAVYPGGPVPP